MTIYITINWVYGDINSHANGINSTVESQLLSAAYAISFAAYITISLGSHSRYLQIYKKDERPARPDLGSNTGDILAVTSMY